MKIKIHTPERPIILADDARHSGGLFYTEVGNTLILIPKASEPGASGVIRAVRLDDGRSVAVQLCARLTPAVGVLVTLGNDGDGP